MSSIPCLNYKKALEKEEEEAQKIKDTLEERSKAVAAATTETGEANGDETEDAAVTSTTTTAAAPDLLAVPNARIESVTENMESHSLNSDQLQEYCKKLFTFKTIKVMRFKSWSARRQFCKGKKIIKNLQRPMLPDGTKLITFPAVNSEGEKVVTQNKKVSAN